MKKKVGLIGSTTECRTLLLWISWSVLLIALDQITKGLIKATILPGEQIPVIKDILFINYVQNYKGFSWFVPDLPKEAKIIFIVFRIIIIFLAFPAYKFYTRSAGEKYKKAFVALVCLTGGITGNLLDDIFASFTTDFIQVFHFPSANLADLFSYMGLLFLIMEMSRRFCRRLIQEKESKT